MGIFLFIQADEQIRKWGKHLDRHFIEHAKVEWERALRYGEEFAIIIFDIDNFKTVNDSYGHLAGDQVLCEVSLVCEREARATDMFARYGGDEFVYLIPNSRAIDIQEFMKPVQKRLSEKVMKIGENEIQITVSMGAGRFDDEVPNIVSEVTQLGR